MGFIKYCGLKLLAGVNWAWTLYRNFDWVSSMKMEHSHYFRFCWIVWNEGHSWLLREECPAFDYWERISLYLCYIGVSSFFCSWHYERHWGLFKRHGGSIPFSTAPHPSRRTDLAVWVRNTTMASCISCIQSSAMLPAKKTILWSHFVPRVQRAGSLSCLSLCRGTWVRFAVVRLGEKSQV